MPIDWIKNNLCAHCHKTCIKGTLKCPNCHLRVRVCPRKSTTEKKNHLVYKIAQITAAARLKEIGWKLPPPTVSCK